MDIARRLGLTCLDRPSLRILVNSVARVDDDTGAYKAIGYADEGGASIASDALRSSAHPMPGAFYGLKRNRHLQIGHRRRRVRFE